MTTPTHPYPDPGDISLPEKAVLEKVNGGEWGKYGRVAMAALSGIPWVGSLIGAAAVLSGENSERESNKVIMFWVKEHEEKLRDLSASLRVVFERFESFGDRIKERIESEEYLSLVRKSFWIWDHLETLEKKEMLRKLIANAGGTTIVQDDWVRMFLEWVDHYSEFHFKVIAEIYHNPRISRLNIWMNIKGSVPVDSSAEADLFKLLIDDLTLGRVIRQAREVNSAGQFEKQSRAPRQPAGRTMKSPFDNEEPYVLTELGQGFVSYVLTDLAPQLGKGDQQP